MFRKAWFRVTLVLIVLASLMVTPLFVSAETENGIIAPANGAKISGAVAVTGHADDPHFKRWDLFIFPAGNEGAKSWIASGDTAGKFSADVDTAKFANGDYTLSLRVVTNPKQNYNEYLTNVTIANAAAAAPAKEEAKEAPAASAKAEAKEAPAASAKAEAKEAPAEKAAAPANGFNLKKDAKISDAAAITGYADDPNFKRWDLFIFPAGNEGAKSWVASGSTAGKFSVDVDTAKFANGEYTLSLRVVTNPKQNYNEYLTNVTIANAAAAAAAAPAKEEAKEAPAASAKAEAKEAPAEKAAAPANGLDLKKDAKLSGTVAVTGYADDPHFKRWDLFIYPAGNEGAKSWVASGNEAGKFSVNVDTTKFANGEYTFSLRIVTNPKQDYSEHTVNFVVANPA